MLCDFCEFPAAKRSDIYEKYCSLGNIALNPLAVVQC